MKFGLGKCVALTVISLGSAGAGAVPPSFQITGVFSNLDGTSQFIQLRETAGMNGQHHFAGLTLTSTHNGVTKQMTFPVDLPDDQTAYQSVLIATAPGVPYIAVADVEISSFPPDFVIPVRFLPTDAGTIDFAGVDQVSYPALPYDGWSGWFRDGSVRAAQFEGFHRSTPWLGLAEFPVAQELINVTEYYNAALDHYFITASAPDIDAIESGRTQGWVPTSTPFAVFGGKLHFRNPSDEWFPDAVCRFYIPPNQGDSHFYSASADECAIARELFPEFVLETSTAFYVRLPDLATGECPTLPGGHFPLRAVFRLWNQRFDSNHRYTTNPILRNYMVQQGYVSEGYGPFGVAFCVF